MIRSGLFSLHRVRLNVYKDHSVIDLGMQIPLE